MVAFMLAATFWQRLRVTIFGSGATQSSDDARRMQRDQALPIVMANPIGHGAGQGAGALDFRNGAGVLTVDSYFLTLLLDYGILGFISYFGFLLSGAWAGLKTFFTTDDDELMLAGVLAISVLNSAVIRLVLSQEQMQPLIFMFMGAIMALVYRHKQAQAAARTGGEFDKSALILARG
jgi:O-antigen ligase